MKRPDLGQCVAMIHHCYATSRSIRSPRRCDHAGEASAILAVTGSVGGDGRPGDIVRVTSTAPLQRQRRRRRQLQHRCRRHGSGQRNEFEVTVDGTGDAGNPFSRRPRRPIRSGSPILEIKRQSWPSSPSRSCGKLWANLQLHGGPSASPTDAGDMRLRARWPTEPLPHMVSFDGSNRIFSGFAGRVGTLSGLVTATDPGNLTASISSLSALPAQRLSHSYGPSGSNTLTAVRATTSQWAGRNDIWNANGQ